MSPSDLALDQVLAMLLERVAQNPQLALEFSASEDEFFRGVSKSGDTERELAARRHAEWFLLERYSEALQSVPIEIWAHEDPTAGQIAPAVADALQAVRQSHCGVFVVTRVSAGEGIWLQDLASGGEYPLREEDASHALAISDLVVGRLYPIDDLLQRLSRAAAVFREPRLVAAIQADLQRAREGRRGIVRVSQVELEQMFFGEAAHARAREETIAWTREELAHAGLSAESIDSLFEHLAGAPLDPNRWVHGAGDAIGALLDEIAFETGADLGRVRRALLEVWPALQEPEAAEREPAEARMDPGAAMEAFDRGRAEGRDLDELFDQLERDLGLDPDDDADSSGVPDFPGVVSAMVVEFLWDAEREHGAERARELNCLSGFADFSRDIGVFEDLSDEHLVLFTTIWVPENGRLESKASALRLLAALDAFCAWAEEQHQLPLHKNFAPILDDLRESLPRIAQANGDPAVEHDESAQGEVFQVVAAGEGDVESDEPRLLARDAGGREHVLPPGLARHLRPGDRLRGAVAHGSLHVLCCYPPESTLVAANLPVARTRS